MYEVSEAMRTAIDNWFMDWNLTARGYQLYTDFTDHVTYLDLGRSTQALREARAYQLEVWRMDGSLDTDGCVPGSDSMDISGHQWAVMHALEGMGFHVQDYHEGRVLAWDIGDTTGRASTAEQIGNVLIALGYEEWIEDVQPSDPQVPHLAVITVR